jgi:hypothetical protein
VTDTTVINSTIEILSVTKNNIKSDENQTKVSRVIECQHTNHFCLVTSKTLRLTEKCNGNNMYSTDQFNGY